MKISQEGIHLIKTFEGCRLTAYKCPAGVWTIGYGHTAGVTREQEITQGQAEDLLKADLGKYENYVLQNVKFPMNQSQFDALVSFTYNCGQGNLKTLLANRTADQVANALLLYNKGGVKVLTGLTRRRKAERELFLSNCEVGEAKTEYFKSCDKKETSIVAALAAVGEESSYEFRKKIAVRNGITNYRGTAEQNRKMLEFMSCGRLIR